MTLLPTDPNARNALYKPGDYGPCDTATATTSHTNEHFDAIVSALVTRLTWRHNKLVATQRTGCAAAIAARLDRNFRSVDFACLKPHASAAL